MSWRRVSARPPAEGELVEAVVDGVPVCIGRSQGALFAVDNTCPHAGGALSDGSVADGRIVCPLHGWAFHVESGECDVNARFRLPVYAAREEDRATFVCLADPTAVR